MTDLYTKQLLAYAGRAKERGLPSDPTVVATSRNPLCGDQVTVGAVIEDGLISQLGFAADACSICMASATVLCEVMVGAPARTLDRATTSLERLFDDSNPTGADSSSTPNPIAVLAPVTAHPSRKSCALLPWRALQDAVPPGNTPNQAPARAHPSPEPDSELIATSSMWESARERLARGERIAIATLVSIEGSSPCPLGSRMVVSADGSFEGSVSGGCIEAAVIQASLELLESQWSNGSQSGRSKLLEFTIDSSPPDDSELPCGGQIRIWVELSPDIEQLDRYLELLDSGATARVVDLTTGAYWLSTEAGTETQPRLVRASGQVTFVEPLRQSRPLILVGGTHIAQKLAKLAPEAGFAPIIVDQRTAWANAQRFPTTPVITESPCDVLPRLTDERTAIVILTHNRELDDPAIACALAGPAFYVGALGGRKNQLARLDRLREQGLSEDHLARLHGPVGLPIGSIGAGEIAISILAEVIAERRRKPTDTPHRQVGALVLAAGSSQRAGSANKLLHPIDGEPMIVRSVRSVIEGGASPVLVVIGHEADRIREALKAHPVQFVTNEKFAEGMGSSIARGVQAIAKQGVDAVLIALGDMPFVRATDVARVIAAHKTSTQHFIVAPATGSSTSTSSNTSHETSASARSPHTARTGHPVLWPARYFDQLQQLTGDVGGKAIIQAAPTAVLRVPTDHPGILRDIDRP